ncbi:MAG: ATP-binding protein [Acidobacteriota bacterium]
MRLWDISHLHRRAFLIYIGTIVAPLCGLLWLGFQSFERQRQALATLTAEKFASALETRIGSAAKAAFAQPHHPIASHSFTIEHGAVIRPALHAPPPDQAPAEFLKAEREELDLNRPDQALESYRRLFAIHGRKGLALSRIARCLAKLGRIEEARAAWRKLAATYPDDRDLSHRPNGIVAALQAGDTAGLYDRIASGRWELAADQAEYFLTQLDAKRTTPYLDHFRFARELEERFRPQNQLREGEIYSGVLGRHRIFYRSEGAARLSGFAVNDDWISGTLQPQLRKEMGIADTTRQDLWVYGGAIGLVLVILSFGVILLLRDISREAAANRVRADLVSSVSHELKTPITLIRLYGETLLRRGELSPLQRGECSRIIVRESERLSRLIDQILTFSRIERGARVYSFERGDLAPVVAGIVEDYREYLEHAGFRLERALEASAPAVRFDPAALSQAVANLLDNAVKYSGESRDIAVRLVAGNGSVTFEVQDHGVGIGAAEQAKIFERFYRAASGGAKGGYGLGLFLVRHIMEAHGGSAEVESEPGRGSRFRLVFPVAT